MPDAPSAAEMSLYELSTLRRSVAMLSTGARTFDREQALDFIDALLGITKERDALKEALQRAQGEPHT